MGRRGSETGDGSPKPAVSRSVGGQGSGSARPGPWGRRPSPRGRRGLRDEASADATRDWNPVTGCWLARDAPACAPWRGFHPGRQVLANLGSLSLSSSPLTCFLFFLNVHFCSELLHTCLFQGADERFPGLRDADGQSPLVSVLLPASRPPAAWDVGDEGSYFKGAKCMGTPRSQTAVLGTIGAPGDPCWKIPSRTPRGGQPPASERPGPSGRLCPALRAPSPCSAPSKCSQATFTLRQRVPKRVAAAPRKCVVRVSSGTAWANPVLRTLGKSVVRGS